jgi:hypothetical protein
MQTKTKPRTASKKATTAAKTPDKLAASAKQAADLFRKGQAILEAAGDDASKSTAALDAMGATVEFYAKTLHNVMRAEAESLAGAKGEQATAVEAAPANLPKGETQMTDDPRKNLTPEEEKALVLEIRNHVITSICDWGLHDLRLIKAAMEQIDSPGGCNHPAGEFVQHILLDLAYKRSLTPDDVQHELISFTQDFEMMVKDTRHFMESYPELMAGGAA